MRCYTVSNSKQLSTQFFNLRVKFLNCLPPKDPSKRRSIYQSIRLHISVEFLSTPVRELHISNTVQYVTFRETDHRLAVKRVCQLYRKLFWKAETYMTVYVIHTDMLTQTNAPDRKQCQWVTAYKSGSYKPLLC
jgi:hypothetical protein